VIDANQGGNVSWNPAPQVQQTLTVTSPKPLAVADHYYTPINTKLIVAVPGVLTNDKLNGATIVANTKPAHGSLTLNPNGSFTYTPSFFFVGIDSFTYTIKNSTGSSTAAVTVDVPARADLAVSLSAPTSAKTASSLTYTLKVTNDGPDPAAGVLTALSVSSGVKVVSSSPAAHSLFGLLTWSAGTLASGASITYSEIVQVTAKVGSTIVTAAATASTSLDPNLANNFAVASCKVTS
jgi:uncharacterized repeat protein (TIGR01451 family)